MDPQIAEIVRMALAVSGTLGVTCIVGYFITARLRMAERKTQEQGSRDLTQTIEEIRQEMAALRDATTRYDLSFDSALQRLESRMSHLEQRVHSGESAAEATPLLRG